LRRHRATFLPPVPAVKDTRLALTCVARRARPHQAAQAACRI
jgi:hypothetical protein